MEKTPSSVINGKMRGEITWMPQKASARVRGESRTISGFAFPGCAVGGGLAAAKLKLVVEKQGAAGAAFLHGESGESAIFGVQFDHAAEIDIADDVDVVKEEGLAGRSGIAQEEMRGFFEAAAGIEQDLLVGDLDAHAEIIVRSQAVDDLPGEMMRVDDDIANAERVQAGKGDLEQGTAANFDQCLGTRVRERTQARAEAGRQNHGLHLPSFSNSRWRTSTFTPLRARRCRANSSAR